MSRSISRKEKLQRRSIRRMLNFQYSQEKKNEQQLNLTDNEDVVVDGINLTLAQMYAKSKCKKCFGRGYLDMSIPGLPNKEFKQYCNCVILNKEKEKNKQ